MESLAEVKLIISSLLISNPLETTVKDLREYYLEEIGEEIPFNNFGFSSLTEFLRSLPEILQVEGHGSNAIVKVVVSEKVAHLDKLIQNQKVTQKSKDQPSRRHTQPIRTHVRRSVSCSGRRNNYYENERNFNGNREDRRKGYFTSERETVSSHNLSFGHKIKYPYNVLRFEESIPQMLVSEISNRQGKTQVNIGSIYDPSKFYIILNENFQALDEMMDDIQIAYSSENHALRIEERDLKKDIFCVSVYNGEYHRGLVKKVRPGKREANIFFVDYGIMDVVDISKIYFLKKVFSKFPRQAIRARLAEILPFISGTPWSIEARNCFIDLVNGKVLNVEKCKLDEVSQVVEFFMLDTTNGQRIFVNKELVKQNFAVRNTCPGDDVCTGPSFEEIEEDVTVPPLSQNDLKAQLKNSQPKVAEVFTEYSRKDQCVFKTRLMEQTVHVVYAHNKFYIAVYEIMHLAKIRNSSISHVWRNITESHCENVKYSLSLQDDPDIYYKLRSYGLNSGKNEIYSLVSVDFIPQFFRYFSDVIFPCATFEDFLDEIYSYI